MHDEKYFPEPEEFRPERHLESGTKSVEEYLDPFDYVFGFGRRVCPGTFSKELLLLLPQMVLTILKGLHFSHLSLFLNITSILQTFNIRKPVDDHGVEVDLLAEFTSGITRYGLL